MKWIAAIALLTIPMTALAQVFSVDTVVSYSNQDVNGATFAIEDAGETIRITGNGWKAAPYVYDVTPNTVLEFDFSSSSQGEMHAIGMDDQHIVSTAGQHFKVYGTDTWTGDPIKYDTYATAAPAVKHYTIPIGEQFQGLMSYLVFVHDHDVPGSTAESVYSNIVLYERLVPAYSTDNVDNTITFVNTNVLSIVPAAESFEGNVMLTNDTLQLGSPGTDLIANILPNTEYNIRQLGFAMNPMDPNRIETTATITVVPPPTDQERIQQAIRMIEDAQVIITDSLSTLDEISIALQQIVDARSTLVEVSADFDAIVTALNEPQP